MGKTGRNVKKTAIMAGALCTALSFNAFAGTWLQGAYSGEGDTWTYIDTSGVQNEGWKWIDANKDGVFESYYIENGKMKADTAVDGYYVNGNGQWTENGEVQKRELPAWLRAAHRSEATDAGEINYPETEIFTGGGDIVQKVIKGHVDGVKEQAEGSKTDADYGLAENELDYDFILGSDKYAGLTLQHYSYYKGAAHGSTAEYYYTLVPEKGILQIEDIGGEKLSEEIAASVRRTLRNKVDSGELYLFDEPEEVKVELRSGLDGEYGGNWLLATDGLHVVFGQYEIAPYAAGIIDITVPYSDIAGSMNDYGKELVGIK